MNQYEQWIETCWEKDNEQIIHIHTSGGIRTQGTSFFPGNKDCLHFSKLLHAPWHTYYSSILMVTNKTIITIKIKKCNNLTGFEVVPTR